uniref:F-box protein n=1 Tax=Solanum tuberosum TaxID=4113 RepID=M1D0Z7_SOLTU
MEVKSFSSDVAAFGKIGVNSVLEAVVAETLLVTQRSVASLLMVAVANGERRSDPSSPIKLCGTAIFKRRQRRGLFIFLKKEVHNPFTFDENYYIFNPTTQQFVTLPRPLSGDVIGMSLAFDPWKSSHYKVISLQISKLEPANHLIEIYSPEHKKWRVSGQTFPRHYDICFKNGLVYWNGAIYVSCIKRFNVEQEKFEEVAIPEVQDHEEDDYRIVYFGESYGHLHLIQVNRQNLALYNVYEMKHDGTGWFLKYEVNVEDVVLAFPHIIRGFLETTDFHYYGMAVLDVVRGDKEEDSFLILHIPGMVILRYNLVDKSFYKLWDFDNGVHDAFAWCLHFDRSNTYQYIESTYCW